MKPYFICY